MIVLFPEGYSKKQLHKNKKYYHLLQFVDNLTYFFLLCKESKIKWT